MLQRSLNKLTNTIKLSSFDEVSETEKNFLDTTVYTGKRFKTESVLETFTETFQYTHFLTSHAPGVKRGFIKREGLRLINTNSSISKALFEDSNTNKFQKTSS